MAIGPSIIPLSAWFSVLVVDPHGRVRDVASHADPHGIPVFAFPGRHAGIRRLRTSASGPAGGRSRSGRRRCTARTACPELDATFADQPAHAAARQVVQRDLIRCAGFRGPEKDAAIVAPIRLHFHVELEVAVLPIGEEEAAAAERTLRPQNHPVGDMKVRLDAMTRRLAHVPPGQVLPVEERSEAVRNLRRRRLGVHFPVVGHLAHPGRQLNLGLGRRGRSRGGRRSPRLLGGDCASADHQNAGDEEQCACSHEIHPARIVSGQCPGTVIPCISPGARRPDRKARRPSILGICEGGATARGGMPRPGIMCRITVQDTSGLYG